MKNKSYVLFILVSISLSLFMFGCTSSQKKLEIKVSALQKMKIQK